MYNVSEINYYWTEIYYHLHLPHKEKITHQVIRILQHIEKNNGIGIGEVATYLNVSHNTASENVKRIIQKGYLQKQRDLSDERKVILCLTDTGKDVLYRNTSLDEEKLKKVLNQFSSKDRQMIEQGFRTLSEGVKKCM
ncbi:MarR family winged helix-turn-helix transcriptional regulator [Aquibacillus sp. 3ASR75-11]|uniref:HTH-type transcriptional regulator SarZ n=1 Tax=Terrihalobacillus insolitus TaxID=2950438 RepID=A0A9X3WTC7_9BACI|nr:MarR family winged helix-turn-helix transcriptional regulator [Terrihalobacillus insolitus]MDC3412456.1 MarR family winged helix-turn-helix transcriptional regulator [Terrihalobacillus insolitus]MDC3423876.1 MarR family winged helix-turn-helix transcriptional regulator [Terrihalobacillus insolitus]